MKSITNRRRVAWAPPSPRWLGLGSVTERWPAVAQRAVPPPRLWNLSQGTGTLVRLSGR